MAATLQRILEELGDNVRLARLRRKLSATQVAERAGMGRTTLTKIEQGHPGVGMGQIINVLKGLPSSQKKEHPGMCLFTQIGCTCCQKLEADRQKTWQLE
jgi:DNA-binding XRE family transcriptional regulator